MNIEFLGGFGEKGRTSLGLSSPGASIILDVGINTNDGDAASPGATYYPAASPARLAATDAIIISHAHEDHIGAMGWCIAQGFRGRFFMTAETYREMDVCLTAYAEPEHRALALDAQIEIFQPHEAVTLGPLTIKSGRSGHTVGGVWLHVSDGKKSVAYCGDIVPGSLVLAMDTMAYADLLVLDGSYADDTVRTADRVAAIKRFVTEHPYVLVPTPLSGKPLELLMAIDGPVSIHASMRASLLDQAEQTEWVRTEAKTLLASRLKAATDWNYGEPWPAGCLLAHDGMGMGGPSRALIARAAAESIAIMLTGHLPKGSPAQKLHAQNRATWLRLPTHPVLSENLALVQALNPAKIVAHSCDRTGLDAMQTLMPSNFVIVQTGDVMEI